MSKRMSSLYNDAYTVCHFIFVPFCKSITLTNLINISAA